MGGILNKNKMVIEFNKEECEKFFDLKYKDGDIIEIRAIDLSKKTAPIIRFAKNKEQFVKICDTLNAIESLQVYAGHNPRIKEGRDALSVKSISHVCLDCDPVRKKGFEKKAATQEEIDLCEQSVDKIINDCKKINIKAPAKIFTGNGFALNWKIKTIEITDENRKEVEDKIKAFTKEMQKDYNSDNMKIDQTGDLPRIYKPCGVMSKKGDNTNDRPFRMAKFVTSNDIVECDKLKSHIMSIDITKEIQFDDKEISGEKDESRSATEYRDVCKQVGQGKNKEEVYKHMNAYAKWATAPEAYRTMTYNKAVRYIESQNDAPEDSNGLVELDLPKGGKLISKFAEEFVNQIKNKDCLFFRPESRDIVEISKIQDEETEKEYTGFVVVKPNRFITLVEKHIIPGYTLFNDKTKTWEFKKTSMKNNVACVVLDSHILQENIPMIERIFQVPIPIIHNGELTFPKRGYDKRFNSWTPFLAPTISNENMPLDEAKKILDNIYCDFCFKDEQDKINSIAGLLTPFLKGLFSRFNIRSPLFFYRGNRERVGKDYNAGITGIIYESEATEESPISSNENSGNNNEELRKKITSSLMRGNTRFHSSNNKGKIDNAVLEGALTNAFHSDRILGGNSMVQLSNEMFYSMSGNMGTTMTPDLSNRCIFINLFFDKEDANSRTFEHPDLHGWVRDNRSLILSALYSLVRNWINNGSKEGNIPFASYPEWARICGGIMESAEIGNPCNRSDNSFLLSTDTETQDMKTFFELMFENSPDKWITTEELKQIIIESKDMPFAYFDFQKRSDQIKFGLKLDKFVGRILSDIKLICIKNPHRNSRNKYKFSKEKRTYKNQLEKSQGKFVNVSMIVNDVDIPQSVLPSEVVGESRNIDNYDNIDTFEKYGSDSK
jgi:hypothetical protein